MGLPVVSIENGLRIDNKPLDFIRALKVDSNMDGPTLFKVEFYGILDGFDNIKSEPLYQFKDKKEYKPHRKYKSK